MTKHLRLVGEPDARQDNCLFCWDGAGESVPATAERLSYGEMVPLCAAHAAWADENPGEMGPRN